jgi:hypothetical protein
LVWQREKVFNAASNIRCGNKGSWRVVCHYSFSAWPYLGFRDQWPVIPFNFLDRMTKIKWWKLHLFMPAHFGSLCLAIENSMERVGKERRDIWICYTFPFWSHWLEWGRRKTEDKTEEGEIEYS